MSEGKTCNVLILCTGSIQRGEVHPMTPEVLEQLRFPPTGLRSNGRDGFTLPSRAVGTSGAEPPGDGTDPESAHRTVPGLHLSHRDALSLQHELRSSGTQQLPEFQ